MIENDTPWMPQREVLWSTTNALKGGDVNGGGGIGSSCTSCRSHANRLKNNEKFQHRELSQKS